MFQVGEDCEVMIRVDEESEEEDFQLVSGETCKARGKNTQWYETKLTIFLSAADDRMDGVFTPVSGEASFQHFVGNFQYVTQSCEMSGMWEIYLCKNFGDPG